MPKFLVHSFENRHYQRQYVWQGSFTSNRAVIEAGCFYRAIVIALRHADNLTFLRDHARNSPTERVYSNGSYNFLVEKLAD